MSNLTLFTYDKRLILQSISQAEKKFFLENMIEHFHRRVTNKSLIQLIYGIYKFTLRGQMFRYLILENPLYTIPNSVVLTAEWTQIYPEYYSIDSSNLNAVIRYFENILEAEISININELHKLSNELIADLEFINQLKLQNFSVTFAYSKWSEEEDGSNKLLGTVGDQKSFIIFSLSNLLKNYPKSNTVTAYGSSSTNQEQHLYTF